MVCELWAVLVTPQASAHSQWWPAWLVASCDMRLDKPRLYDAVPTYRGSHLYKCAQQQTLLLAVQALV
jgi:hypothetical protein